MTEDEMVGWHHQLDGPECADSLRPALSLGGQATAVECSTPGFPLHHQLSDPAQTHVHQVGDVIQPSYPLSSPSPPAFNLSQH